jgi:DNA-binding HxlR family transcriptional regulator
MKIEFVSCPVQASLKILGREWAFLVLTSIALFRAQRFNDMLRAMPGMSKRLLAMRLSELEEAGFIVRAETRRGYVRWELTEKGADVVPILLTMVQFGSKWYADEVFADGSPRTMGEIFDEGYIRRSLGIESPRPPTIGGPSLPSDPVSDKGSDAHSRPRGDRRPATLVGGGGKPRVLRRT